MGQRTALVILILGLISVLNGQVPVKQVHAGRTTAEIVIDGLLNEEAWEGVEGAAGFIQKPFRMAVLSEKVTSILRT